MNALKRCLMQVNSVIRRRAFSSPRLARWLFGVDVLAPPEMQSYCEWGTILQRIIMPRYVRQGARILDLGTGAHGMLAIYSKQTFPDVAVVATDILAERVDLARQTAARNDADVECIVADMFHGLSGRFDVILFYPPVIPNGELEEMGYELKTCPGLGSTRCWSGDGGTDGREVIRLFLSGVNDYLTDNGRAIMCVNPAHLRPGEVRELCANAGLPIQRTHTLPGISIAYIITRKKHTHKEAWRARCGA